MSRLVVVSNRVSVPSKAASAGGLAVALQTALRAKGGLWFGWSGRVTDAEEIVPPNVTHERNVDYALVDLPQRDNDEYYAGFANRVLWPLLHYRLDLTDFSRKDMAGYFRVNRAFAQQLAPLIKPDDVIWVHDYHLIPLASELRTLGLQNRMGFFLHIPWPPADVLMTLPPHEAIVKALAEYDLVGFQTEYDADNFAGCLVREGLGHRHQGNVIDAYGRKFRFGAFPIGIETKAFARIARAAEKSSTVLRMKENLGARDLVMGVDRLDYSKGLGQRMEGYARFVEMHPAMRGNVTYLQVTPKSRSEVPEFAEMQRTLAEIAGRYNGAYGDIDWTPIRYVNRTMSRNVLAGLYRIAKLGLVTPLRDGMNLVAKEYVASQDPEDPGVLVLSRFAGAARELTQALLVNPYDIDDIANAIARGLAMPREERIARWTPMYARLEAQNVNVWCDSFLTALDAAT